MENNDTHRYNCPRCHYKTDDRTNFIKHLKRKTPCPSLYSEMSQLDILASIEKPHKCPHCDKAFTLKTNLSRHKKTHTDEERARTININTNNITNTDSHNTTIDNSHSHNTNNISIANLTIQLLPFGKEDISNIQNDTAFLNACIDAGVRNAIPLIVKEIFLNDTLPQNKNVKMGTNHAPAEMMVFKLDSHSGETSWARTARAAVLDDLVRKSATVLQNHNYNLYKDKHDATTAIIYN